ncbi:MAG: glycosyltransferase [Pseudomonadota bacterium]
MSERQPEIAFFTSDLRVGGAKHCLINLIENLSGRGLRIDLVLQRAEGPLVAAVPESVRVLSLGTTSASSGVVRLAAYLERSRPEHVVSMLMEPNLIALRARAKSGRSVSVFTWEHENVGFSLSHEPWYRRHWIQWSIRRSYPAAERVLAVSQGVAGNLRKILGPDSGRIHVLPGALLRPDLVERMAETPDHPWFRDGGPPIVLAVGRLNHVKGFPVLLRAFALVRRSQNVRLLILGDGPRRSRLEQLIRRLDLSEHVALPGFAANPFSYMSRVRMLVLPSYSEGLPGVLIEALACGCPVVSTNCDYGPREILQDGLFGELVPPGSPRSLAAGILKALSAPGRRVEPDLLSPYRVDRVADRFLELLRPERSDDGGKTHGK